MLKRLLEKLSWDTTTRIFAAAIYFKFICFDIVWCSYTTFTPMSVGMTYIAAAIATLTLMLPWILTRIRGAGLTVCLLIDILLVTNLMYYRTYYSAIPPTSYMLIGNLADFTESVVDSLRWCDLLFPLSTAIAAIILCRPEKVEGRCTSRKGFLMMYIVVVLIFTLHQFGGGKCRSRFFQSYDYITSSADLYFSGPPIFTLFGTIYYELNRASAQYTDNERSYIESWLAERTALGNLPESARPRMNCVIIFAESLESWLLETVVENQEITPHMNALLREPSTLYAPYVLTQTNDGRSIDAQLLVLAGLLPLQSGTYSALNPNNTYYTLPKALKQFHGTRNYLMTIDKLKTWNQSTVANSFGIDTMISYPDFKMTEIVNARRRVGDRAFFAQCADMMRRGEIWPVGERAFVQMVTYSMHVPFVIPDDLRSVAFSSAVPQVMSDYMTAARYTDEGIGLFVDYLKSRPDYDDTLIVITGDHEGLASYRKELCESAAGRGVVSEHQYTPFIVLNSPVGMQYDKVMGQIDIYPTLLDLLGLNGYRWHGLGRSILDPHKPAAAATPQMAVEGDCDEAAADFLRRAFTVSDKIIRFDYFSREESFDDSARLFTAPTAEN